jgi:hypothetical protein
MTKRYEITDKDIESTLLYLKYHDPENATPEKAISMLEDLRQGYHEKAHNNPESLIELQKELDKNKQTPKPND